MGLKDKVAIISGASRGLGRSFALGLAAEGCHVTLMARGEEALKNTAREVEAAGVRAVPVVGDVTSPSDCERAVQAAVYAFGSVDVLVNNAGGGGGADKDEAWQQAFEVNVLAAARLTRLPPPLAVGAASSVSRQSGDGRPAARWSTTR